VFGPLLSSRPLVSVALPWLLALFAACGSDGPSGPPPVFQSGNLVVSRTVYTGTASTVSVGQTLPGGGVRTATYDKEGILAGEADNQGQTLLYEHDALGRVSLKKSSTGLEIESRYDALGRLAGVRDNLGRALGLRYTPGGQISALIDSTGAATKFGYDLEGRLTEVIDPLGTIKRFAFSPAGELTNVQEANGDTVKIEYDGAGRISVIRHPGGGATRLEYNAMSSPLRITDPLGAQTSLAYDEAGRLITGLITSLRPFVAPTRRGGPPSRKR
jgi:YD repeat-containing protein